MAGCDVLSLENGYRFDYGMITQPEIMDTVTAECHEVIKRCVKKEYERIFFISKSIGHSFSLKITEQLDNKRIKHICYTPIDAHVSEIVKNDCIVLREQRING